MLLGMDRRQWVVLLASWLAWGFGFGMVHVLINYVARSSQLLPSSGTLTPTLVVLFGYVLGGVALGSRADGRLGRRNGLRIAVALYALGAVASAFAPNLAVLLTCWIVVGIGVGGAWAVGVALVYEAMPKSCREAAAVVFYTGAPVAVLLATLLKPPLVLFLKQALDASLHHQMWRIGLLLCGLASVVFFPVCRRVEESRLWRNLRHEASALEPVAELFHEKYRARTLSGLAMSTIAIAGWWTVYVYITTPFLSEPNIYRFSLGGLLGTMITLVMFFLRVDPRKFLSLFFLFSSAAIFAAFGLGGTTEALLLPIGTTVWGVFALLAWLLPDMYPTRLRATGSGLCYNLGRVPAAVGAMLVSGAMVRDPGNAKLVLSCIGIVPLAALLVIPWFREN